MTFDIFKHTVLHLMDLLEIHGMQFLISAISCLSDKQEAPTPVHKPEDSSPVVPDSLPSAASISVPEENPEAPGSSTANLALLRLLQSAFNLVPPKTFPSEKIPPQRLYQALDRLNRYRGSENGLFSDYSNNFYRAQPYRHRDDRLLQALFDMLGDDQQ